MTDEDPTVPQLDTHQNGSSGPVASLDAVTTLIHSFASMMANMEKRITEQINANAAASKERWGRWEQEFKEYREANDRRIAGVEDRLGHLEDDDQREKLVWDARWGPVRNVIIFLSRNWKTILVVLFAILGAIGLAERAIEDGLHSLGLP